MAWHALQKRVRGLFSSRRQQSPSSSPSGQPCATTTTSASEHNEKVQGRLHHAAARGDLAWLRRWRWYYKRIGIDPADQQRRTPLHLASVNGHTDVVRYLAGKNCKLNVADNLKRTPLMRPLLKFKLDLLNIQRSFHLLKDPICRLKEKYHDVLTKN